MKKGDKIRVMTGKDRGRDGVIEKVYLKQRAALILGINQYKKHIKKNDKAPQGGVVTVPRPVDVSKLALLCSHCGQPTRIGYVLEKEKKVRVCKKCSQKL